MHGANKCCQRSVLGVVDFGTGDSDCLVVLNCNERTPHAVVQEVRRFGVDLNADLIAICNDGILERKVKESLMSEKGR